MEKDFDKVIKFIVDYRIHQGMLAQVIGLNQGSFSDKMRGLRRAKFTKEQQVLITKYLKKMGVEINKTVS